MLQYQYLALGRHGQSFANVGLENTDEDALYFSVSGSDMEVGITEKGSEQCLFAGDLLHWLFPARFPLKRIWISQFRRIEESASRMASRLSYPVDMTVDRRLNKRSYGQFWNLTYRGVEVLHKGEQAYYQQFGPLKYRPPGGENYFDLFERVDDFMLNQLAMESGNQLVVGHSAVLLSIQRHLGLVDDREVLRQYETVCWPNGYLRLYRRLKRSEPWQTVFLSDLLRP